MSIVVRDMQMPKKCQYCGFLRWYPANGNIWCNADNKLLKRGWFAEIDLERPKDCPLFEIKSWKEI